MTEEFLTPREFALDEAEEPTMPAGDEEVEDGDEDEEADPAAADTEEGI